MERACAKCGKPIPPARLAAKPSATLCVRCKAKSDDRLLRAWDIGDALVTGGEVTLGEAQRMTHDGGG